MVSKWWTHRASGVQAPRRYQSKIYIESNQKDFQPIFGEFTSMQTLTIYRRLLVRSKRRHQPQFNQKKSPGSRDVFPASHGILARACARAVAEGKDTCIGHEAAARRVRCRIGCGR